jgi:UPF0755 protein
MQKKTTKTILVCIAETIVLVCITGMVFFFQMRHFISTPFDPGAEEKVFIIHTGQTLHRIASNLETNHFISSQTLFKLFARMQGATKKLQSGEYNLSASQSPEALLNILTSGRVKLYRITIPEGLNIKETGRLVKAMGFCSQAEFVKLCKDGPFIESVGIHARTLEGYLFPDTYFFPKTSNCEYIIHSMVRNFHEQFLSKWKKKAQLLNFTVHEIITLASIIEKETGDARERPLISSVFHNRLNRRMRLESDPTVIYGIKNFDGNIKKIHLKTETPYNTYQIKGLPEGPIANPGKHAIEAALYPATSDFLFFVSKKDTTHYFSVTVKEHNKAVHKYQLRK